MKTLIAILSFFSLAVAAATPAAAQNFVHLHKGAISFAFARNGVLAKVTAVCTGADGTVAVTITQTGDQSNSSPPATVSGMGSSTVECNGQSKTIAVSVHLLGANIGDATASATLTVPMAMPVTDGPKTIRIRFPVLEGMEQEEGGND